MLLVKANKWEDKDIDKEDKFSNAKDELNDISRHLKELREAQRKAQVEVESCRLKESQSKYELEAMKE